MKRETRLLINTMLGMTTITLVALSIYYFLGELDVAYLKESLASFLPAIFIGFAVLSVIIMLLKAISGIIRYLHKKV